VAWPCVPCPAYIPLSAAGSSLSSIKTWGKIAPCVCNWLQQWTDQVRETPVTMALFFFVRTINHTNGQTRETIGMLSWVVSQYLTGLMAKLPSTLCRCWQSLRLVRTTSSTSALNKVHCSSRSSSLVRSTWSVHTLVDIHCFCLPCYNQTVIQKEKDHRKALVILWGVNKERAKMSHLLHELHTWAPKYEYIIIS
jgi:hypothetical protein